jgi:hypothetical protein
VGSLYLAGSDRAVQSSVTVPPEWVGGGVDFVSRADAPSSRSRTMPLRRSRRRFSLRWRYLVLPHPCPPPRLINPDPNTTRQ